MGGLYQDQLILQKLDQLLAGGVPASSASGASLPPGYISPMLAGAVPAGWVPLDGRELVIADNPVLYALFGDRFGGVIDELATRANAASLVPAMTANNAPAGYVASASSEYSAAYQAFKAFDGILPAQDSTNAWITTSGVYTGWLRVDLQAAKGLASYGIATRGTTGADPKDFTLEGSNDAGATWAVLDARSGITAWAVGSSRSFELDASQLASTYTSFRLNVTAADRADSYLAIAELVLNGGDPVMLHPASSAHFRLPNLHAAPADLPGSVWCVKAG